MNEAKRVMHDTSISFNVENDREYTPLFLREYANPVSNYRGKPAGDYSRAKVRLEEGRRGNREGRRSDSVKRNERYDFSRTSDNKSSQRRIYSTAAAYRTSNESWRIIATRLPTRRFFFKNLSIGVNATVYYTHAAREGDRVEMKEQRDFIWHLDDN